MYGSSMGPIYGWSYTDMCKNPSLTDTVIYQIG